LTVYCLRGWSIPSLRHPAFFGADLLENKNIRLNDPTTEWELSQNKFGYYFVGLEVLVMLGYVQRTKSVILPGNKEDVLLGSSKLSLFALLTILRTII
jgi:hypothetical protein